MYPEDWLIKIDKNAYIVCDHMHGFTKDYTNHYLDKLVEPCKVYSLFVMPHVVKINYPHIEFINAGIGSYVRLTHNLDNLQDHDTNKCTTFLSCFNNNDHVGRQFLCSHLYKQGWWNIETCTKNFTYSFETLDGNLGKWSKNERLDRKFIVDTSDNAINFYKTLYQFGTGDPNGSTPTANYTYLKSGMEKAFLHLVSETIPTSYVPVLTEKCITPMLSKTMWIAYGPLGYHKMLVDIYGFKLYNSIFDYTFDTLANPVERLLSLTKMLSVFSQLNKDDWFDLYHMEKETAEFNKDHFLSRAYLKNVDIETPQYKGQSYGKTI